jgi:hypothetical protein
MTNPQPYPTPRADSRLTGPGLLYAFSIAAILAAAAGAFIKLDVRPPVSQAYAETQSGHSGR